MTEGVRKAEEGGCWAGAGAGGAAAAAGACQLLAAAGPAFLLAILRRLRKIGGWAVAPAGTSAAATMFVARAAVEAWRVRLESSSGPD